jgi:hypothetical protein
MIKFFSGIRRQLLAACCGNATFAWKFQQYRSANALIRAFVDSLACFLEAPASWNREGQ